MESNATESFAQILIFHLSSKSAIQRTVIGLVIEEWAQSDQVGCVRDCFIIGDRWWVAKGMDIKQFVQEGWLGCVEKVV